MRTLREIFADRRERKLHDDRDLDCRYWWGDRGGYDINAVRCPICNPRQADDGRRIVTAERRELLRMLEAARFGSGHYLDSMLRTQVMRLYAEAERQGVTFKDDDVEVALRLEVHGALKPRDRDLTRADD